jgi:hypothetical protein
MNSGRVITFVLHVAGLLLLAAGTVILFDAADVTFRAARDVNASLTANPVLVVLGLVVLGAGCDCLRRAVQREQS